MAPKLSTSPTPPTETPKYYTEVAVRREQIMKDIMSKTEEGKKITSLKNTQLIKDSQKNFSLLDASIQKKLISAVEKKHGAFTFKKQEKAGHPKSTTYIEGASGEFERFFMAIIKDINAYENTHGDAIVGADEITEGLTGPNVRHWVYGIHDYGHVTPLANIKELQKTHPATTTLTSAGAPGVARSRGAKVAPVEPDLHIPDLSIRGTDELLYESFSALQKNLDEAKRGVLKVGKKERIKLIEELESKKIGTFLAKWALKNNTSPDFELSKDGKTLTLTADPTKKLTLEHKLDANFIDRQIARHFLVDRFEKPGVSLGTHVADIMIQEIAKSPVSDQPVLLKKLAKKMSDTRGFADILHTSWGKDSTKNIGELHMLNYIEGREPNILEIERALCVSMMAQHFDNVDMASESLPQQKEKSWYDGLGIDLGKNLNTVSRSEILKMGLLGFVVLTLYFWKTKKSFWKGLGWGIGTAAVGALAYPGLKVTPTVLGKIFRKNRLGEISERIKKLSGDKNGYNNLSLSETINTSDLDGKKDFAWLFAGGSKANIVNDDMTWLGNPITPKDVRDASGDKKYQMHMALILQASGGTSPEQMREGYLTGRDELLKDLGLTDAKGKKLPLVEVKEKFAEAGRKGKDFAETYDKLQKESVTKLHEKIKERKELATYLNGRITLALASDVITTPAKTTDKKILEEASEFLHADDGWIKGKKASSETIKKLNDLSKRVKDPTNTFLDELLDHMGAQLTEFEKNPSAYGIPVAGTEFIIPKSRPKINTITTSRSSPTITGTFDGKSIALSRNITISIGKKTYSPPDVSLDEASGTWELNLATLSTPHVLTPGDYDMKLSLEDVHGNILKDVSDKDVIIVASRRAPTTPPTPPSSSATPSSKSRSGSKSGGGPGSGSSRKIPTPPKKP